MSKKGSPMLVSSRDLPFPDTYALIVGGRHNTFVVINEGYRVDSTKMAVILLHDFAAGGVPLDNLLVRCTA